MSTETRARRPRTDDGLFVLGLIGGVGSGKSAVADALAAAGALVLEADLVGHEVTDTDSEVRAALVAEYGAEVYRPDGRLDRARVAARVFADPAARARLDALVHPRLVARLERRLADLRARGVRAVVVLDAALLLDWGLERDCDAVLAVAAPLETRLARLRGRGMGEEDARRRIAAQRGDDAFRAAADATLENAGSLDDLAHAARHTVAALMARRATEGAGAC
jgi:dephospho-CoA kinase